MADCAVNTELGLIVCEWDEGTSISGEPNLVQTSQPII